MDFANDGQVDFKESRVAAIDWQKLREAAIQMLGANDFRVALDEREKIAFDGPGMTSNRQSEIRGASRIEISHHADTVTLQAELKGVRQIETFLKFFPLLLGGGMALFFAVLFTLLLPNPVLGLTIAGIVLVIDVGVWAVLGPIIIKSMRKRAEQSLSRLLTNLISMASYSSLRQ